MTKKLGLEISKSEKKLLMIPFVMAVLLYLGSRVLKLSHSEIYLISALLLFPCITGFIISRVCSMGIIKKARRMSHKIARMSDNDRAIAQKGAKDILNGNAKSEFAKNIIKKFNKM